MIGIDEVGRGAWAGPLLVVAARARTSLPPGLTDSKLLSKKQRQAFVSEIRESCDLGEGWVPAYELDNIGLASAMRLAVARSLKAIKATTSEAVIMDGYINYCDPSFMKVSCIPKADVSQPIVSAASVYAKQLRDEHMSRLAYKYPLYSFETNVGYGTKHHLSAITKYGLLDIHRQSFHPMKRHAKQWSKSRTASRQIS